MDREEITETAMYQYIGQLEEKIRILQEANEGLSRANLDYKYRLEKIGADNDPRD